jgi:hypothetical protein
MLSNMSNMITFIPLDKSCAKYLAVLVGLSYRQNVTDATV